MPTRGSGILFVDFGSILVDDERSSWFYYSFIWFASVAFFRPFAPFQPNVQELVPYAISVVIERVTKKMVGTYRTPDEPSKRDCVTNAFCKHSFKN